ncbi:phosphotransferase family protein [Allorhizocola rhizosphaerae]|uniref:phosphotransferase family protein n=1 Tax=Allorhizocola rhizosphaerae TaxID=1872709 RepID=UPI0013C31513|nr:aminoglycoside phosphotransferase family protein [Allorhizocola rhizosphaerae]
MHDAARWHRYLRETGFPLAEALSSGMEGLTFTLGRGLVAKVWFGRSASDVRPLVAFYEELGRQSLPFATPDVVEVREVDGRAVTIERFLPGVALSAALDSGAVKLAVAQDCALLVLEALATTQAGPAAEALPVFNERSPLRARAGQSWGEALVALLQRRLRQFGPQLRSVVTDFDKKVDRVCELLNALPPAPQQIVHGDLCLPNVLVDEAGRAQALLDWGFLSTKGDPAFDASTFAGFFDMYGPEARLRDAELTELICARLGYSKELLMLYRAYYAMIGSNAYGPTGQDWHFAWCVATLDRPDVAEALHG